MQRIWFESIDVNNVKFLFKTIKRLTLKFSKMGLSKSNTHRRMNKCYTSHILREHTLKCKNSVLDQKKPEY